MEKKKQNDAARVLYKNVYIHEFRTSIKIEKIFWDQLRAIAEAEGVTIRDICTCVNDQIGSQKGFTMALRVFVVRYLVGGEQRPKI